MSKDIIENLKIEMELIKIDIREQKIIIRKYQKKVDKEKAKLNQVYHSIEDVEMAFGNEEIDLKERDKWLDYFDGLNETMDEKYLDYLLREKKNNLKNLKFLEQELFNEELVEIARS